MSARFDLAALERLAAEAGRDPWYLTEAVVGDGEHAVYYEDSAVSRAADRLACACDPATVAALVRAVQEAQHFADGDGSLAELVAALALFAPETGEETGE